MAWKRRLTPFGGSPITISPDRISWAAYGGFEGPVYYGDKPRPTPLDGNSTWRLQAVDVTCTVESGTGTYNAVNMYDAGVCSVGMLQFSEAAGGFAVSDLLGRIQVECPEAFRELYPILTDTGYRFGRLDTVGVDAKLHRFFLADTSEITPVLTARASREMFFGSPDVGKIGTWTPAAKERARAWATGLASVLIHPDAQNTQLNFARDKVFGYIPTHRSTFLADLYSRKTSTEVDFLRVLLASFAVNSPYIVAAATTLRPFGLEELPVEEICSTLLCIGHPFWAARMTSALNRLGTASKYAPLVLRSAKALADFNSSGLKLKDIQAALIRKGVSIGHSGADGVYGTATHAALSQYLYTHPHEGGIVSAIKETLVG